MFKRERFFQSSFISIPKKRNTLAWELHLSCVSFFYFPVGLLSQGLCFFPIGYLHHQYWTSFQVCGSSPYVTTSFPGSSLLLPRFREVERGPWEHGGQGPAPSTDQVDHLRVSPRADTFYFSVSFKGAARVKNVWEGGAVWMGTSRYNPDHFNEKVSCYCLLVFEALL